MTWAWLVRLCLRRSCAYMNDAAVRFARRSSVGIGLCIGFVVIAVLVRGTVLSDWGTVNADEAELIAQGRAAVRSPVPFTTWTMGTTGPFWVFLIAALGALGFPLTLAFAHLLSAVLMGLIGFTGSVIARRALGDARGLVLTALWWLPLALIYPVGGRTDFGALNTELLPGLLVLIAAAVPLKLLEARPWMFAVVGLLGALAIGSKYQVLPLVGIVLVVQLISLRATLRRILVAALWWVAGALVPIVVIVLMVATSPDVSPMLVQQNLGFLGSYAGGVDPATRLVNSIRLIGTQKVLIAAALILARLCVISTRPVLISRLLYLFAGLVSVVAGGMGFGHYLILLYVAVILAVALPVREGAELLPGRRLKQVVMPVVAAGVVAVVIVLVVVGRVTFSSPATVVAALSADSVSTDARLATLCPPDSDVMVWGWSPELYSSYSWRNSVPFMSSIGLTANAENLALGVDMVEDAVATSDCVMDAVGSPFFGSAEPLVTSYPQTAEMLDSRYRAYEHILDCESCTLYVAR